MVPVCTNQPCMLLSVGAGPTIMSVQTSTGWLVLCKNVGSFMLCSRVVVFHMRRQQQHQQQPGIVSAISRAHHLICRL